MGVEVMWFTRMTLKSIDKRVEEHHAQTTQLKDEIDREAEYNKGVITNLINRLTILSTLKGGL
jgi:hypothetical protein